MRVGFVFFCEGTLEGHNIEFQIGGMQLLNVWADLRKGSQNSTSLFQLTLLKAHSK